MPGGTIQYSLSMHFNSLYRKGALIFFFFIQCIFLFFLALPWITQSREDQAR